MTRGSKNILNFPKQYYFLHFVANYTHPRSGNSFADKRFMLKINKLKLVIKLYKQAKQIVPHKYSTIET